MKNRKKEFLAVISGIAIMMSLGACGVMNNSKEFNPVQNSIYVQKDKTVKSALIQNAQGDQYNAADLQAYAQAEADAFNADNGSGETPAVSIVSCEKTGDILSIIFQYDTPAHMIAWAEYSQDDSMNITDMSVMSVSEADEAGILGVSFTDANGKAVDVSEIKKGADDIVAAIKGSANIVCEGDIKYMSSGVSKTDSNSASVQGTDDNCIIIFK